MSLPPLRATILEKSPGAMSLVPLNIRCSRKCAMPEIPGCSSAEPTLYQTIWVTTGARWFSTSTTCIPLSRVTVCGLKTAACDRCGIITIITAASIDAVTGMRANITDSVGIFIMSSHSIRHGGANWLLCDPGTFGAHGYRDRKFLKTEYDRTRARKFRAPDEISKLWLSAPRWQDRLRRYLQASPFVCVRSPGWRRRQQQSRQAPADRGCVLPQPPDQPWCHILACPARRSGHQQRCRFPR